jgi:hypothetical protein
METKKGGIEKFLDSFHQTSWNFVGISIVVCGCFWGLKKFKMVTVAMVTKVQNIWNSFRTADPFEIWHPIFSLSRSTRCGCCSYQVSSISVWRVTSYDHFCVFHFFFILAVSMATAAILEKSTHKGRTSHGIWYSYKVS